MLPFAVLRPAWYKMNIYISILSYGYSLVTFISWPPRMVTSTLIASGWNENTGHESIMRENEDLPIRIPVLIFRSDKKRSAGRGRTFPVVIMKLRTTPMDVLDGISTTREIATIYLRSQALNH